MEDKSRRALVDARNEAESMIYQTEKAEAEFKDKVPAEVMAKVDQKKGALKAAAAGDDTKAIRTAMEDLRQASTAIGQAMYGTGAAQQGPSAQPPGANGGGDGGGSGGSGPDVIDADFTESKE